MDLGLESLPPLGRRLTVVSDVCLEGDAILAAPGTELIALEVVDTVLHLEKPRVRIIFLESVGHPRLPFGQRNGSF